MISLTEPDMAFLVPQADGSDTGLFLRSLINNPIARASRPKAGEPTFFNGRVAIRFTVVTDGKLTDAPAHHHHLFKAEALLKKCWPEIHQQFGEIMNEFHPKYMPDNESDGYVGFMSHKPPGLYGSMWATINDYLCLSLAFVYEMAHNKLLAIGQQFTDASPLFLNDAAELYDSLVWLDVPRPIAAVFNSFYALTHVLALNRRLLERATLDEQEEAYVIGLLNKNARRTRVGIDIIAKCGRLTLLGQKFVNDVLDWAREEMRLSEKYIRKIKYGQPLLIIGPTGAGKSTFSASLSKKTGMQLISFDAICWSYWYQLPVLQGWLLKSVGEEKLTLWNKTLSDVQKYNVLKRIVEKEIITRDAIDWLKYQLMVYTIDNFKGHILDAGGGHVIFYNNKYLTLLKQLLLQNDVKVVQIRPLTHVEHAKEIVAQRMRERSYTTDELAKAKNNVFNPAYRTLSDYVIDSNDPVETCISNFLELTEITQMLEAN